MITPQKADCDVCELAYNKGLDKDILVNTYCSSPDDIESYPFPAFEVDCLLQWLRAKGVIIFVVPYTDPKDSDNTLYEVTWKDHHTTWSGYSDYLTALNIGLYNALETIESENR